ncbi:uncharacterized protein MEPE_04416 [Melanopsichium pennsylvanicum]|uniref:Uncharacterized protein n=2 Tax=Melanopsichium pennsylvanicum TaxID=63383 RepID=A0AAJ4XPV7_9BASI|nr:putative protein [Melanopsichium pennsylvanicum 4]SNX85707.1 uncharacterized protein MEPE_04416 [Melanopsichium pennsylvanicum]
MSTFVQPHQYQVQSHTPSARAGSPPNRYDTHNNSSHGASHELRAGPSASGRSSITSAAGATMPVAIAPTSALINMASQPATSPTQPKASHLGSELFDAIVQAADPRHPDHAAWQERYGSLSNRSSRASFSSGHKREKLASPSQAGKPNSCKSLDHSEFSNRKWHTARKAGNWDSAYLQLYEATGSDADDPGYVRSTPVRASFEGSVRSHYSSSISSRRRNRRLRDPSRPKPLVPPIPPPRVTSSTNWQSTFGSPSLPELASSTPRTNGQPSSSGNTSDNHDHTQFAVHTQPLHAPPSAPPSLRMVHPYASAMTFEKEQDLRPLQPLPGMTNTLQSGFELHETERPGRRPEHKSNSTPGHSSLVASSLAQMLATSSPSVACALQEDQSFLILPRRPSATSLATSSPTESKPSSQQEQTEPLRKSTSKIRRLLGSEAPALGGPPLPEKPQTSFRSVEPEPSSPHGSPPAVPPKHVTRMERHRPSGPVSKMSVPEFPSQHEEAIRQSLDASRKIDLNVFPLRRDDEFRVNANEFEMSDESEAEEDSRIELDGRPQFPTTSASSKPSRGPGVVRRSLDSIISPFRAGLLNSGGASGLGRLVGSTSKSNLEVPDQEPIAEGRRSFSDTLRRPFQPRMRNATLGRQVRPLSKVLDRPEDEIADVPHPCNAHHKNAHRMLVTAHAVGFPASVGSHIRSQLRTGDVSSEPWPEAGAGSPQSHSHSGIPPFAKDATISGMSASTRATRKTNLRGQALPHLGQGAAEPSWDTSANAGWPNASLSSSRSLASTFSRSAGNFHENGIDSPFDAFARSAANTMQAHPQQPPKGKFGGFLTRVKGSITPKGTPSTPSLEFSALHSSPHQISNGMTLAPSISSPGGSRPNAAPAKKPAFRNRVKSFTSPRGGKGSKEKLANVPAVPAIPCHLASQHRDAVGYQEHVHTRLEDFLTQSNSSSPQPRMLASTLADFAAPDLESTRSVWEESPQISTSDTFTSTEKASRSFGRLLRRKKTQEDLDAVIDSFVPLPPKMSHPDITEEAAPRPSMSSVRGFDVVEPGDSSVSVGQTRTTIRKTLSPALLSDTPHLGIEAGMDDSELSSIGHSEVWTTGAPQSEARVDALPHRMSEDAAEELSDTTGDEQRFRSPLGRFIRGNSAVDRLSRVEEMSERLSYIADPVDSNRSTTSMHASPNTRSFGEHRSVRRSVSGNVRGQTLPPTLELASPQDARPRKVSLDILRPNKKEEMLRDASAFESSASLGSTALSSAATTKFTSKTPKSPATPGFGEQLTPSWRSTSFSTIRTGRTSFSQDRDRAPVASPISPPLPTNRGVGQAIKRIGIKSKSKKVSKGIGPSDVIVLDFEDEAYEDGESSRPSMSVEPRPSFGGSARPSFGGGPRPSIEATGCSSFLAAEMATKLLEVEASSLISSPIAPSFGSTQLANIEMGKSTTSLHRNEGEIAGLGIGSVQWSEGMPLHKTESVDVSGSASDGTFTSQGIQTPENGSLSHSYSKMDGSTAGAITILAGEDDGTTITGGQMVNKSAELLAFEDMLGKFPQQQKNLLQDISARVTGKTPIAGKEDGVGDSGVFHSTLV